jgi:DNA-binding transcriptional ArsR family regulator
MPDASDAASFDRTRAELFDALGHPVRIRILHALEDGPLGFSDLRRKVGLESGGHLQFHLGKLDGLVQTTADNTYMLTDDGREALRIVSTQAASSRGLSDDKRQGTKIIVSRAVFAGLVALVILLASVAVYQQLEIGGLNSQHPSTSVVYIGLPDSASATNVSSGLTFVLVLNSTQLYRGQTVNITAYEQNDLSTPNNLTAADDWAESWFIGWGNIGSCNSFVNAQVFEGYYTETNISVIQNGPGPYGLQLAAPVYLGCPFIPGAWSTYFPFQPYESRVGYYYSADGYYRNSYSLNSTFGLFDPGIYTVAAGDEWGQMVILHFVVSP